MEVTQIWTTSVFLGLHLNFFFPLPSFADLCCFSSTISSLLHPVCCFSGSCSSYLSSSAPNSYPCLSHLAPHCSSSCSVHILKSVCMQEPQPLSILKKPSTLPVLLLERDKTKLRACKTLKMTKMLLLFQNVIPICSGNRPGCIIGFAETPAWVGRVGWKQGGSQNLPVPRMMRC